jgi:hypothetical protein
VEHYNGEGETRLSVNWDSTPPTATPAPTAVRPTAPAATVAPAVTAAPTAANGVDSWNPIPGKVECTASDYCYFSFSRTYASKDYHHRIEFVDDAGNSIIMGIESTLRRFVLVPKSELRNNLAHDVPYHWRVLLFKPTGTGEELVKRGPLSEETYTNK